ncbi:16S rRNA (cytidine(1402)-2'-O)-methyltransferase [Jannaschia sp. Os4]|uniref:16S rRNA (cytidine(1402)-2'-O)-methyltransferase n=1 Tax=Jannaschia sp. Os4 TaxID=2807617 RepID=UPI001939C57D|nr:16S rRNA (cytidine(1402)-2'-O)-methyltransferase [Jannaschia sp. Os4]MBM2575360.1 16S rRNA (cytidine(1402)-2'-O)-methyltransferase [Jannaschia sp. Os4]
MSDARHTPPPGGATVEPGLHLVSVPIGAARDVTLRALDLLAGADVLAAEDTRSLRRLLEIHGIALGDRPLVAYHEHSPPAARARLAAALAGGRSVAYASEAGTPLVADPGFRLGAEARAAGAVVRAAPGASAVLAALVVAGLPTDRFLFAGFLPPKRAARRAALAELGGVRATLVLYESPKRVGAMLADAAEVLGPREAAVCRELTKRFEEVARGTLAELSARYGAEAARGEIVVVIDRGAAAEPGEGEVEAALAEAMDRMSVKSAVKEVSERTGMARKQVYEMALRMKDRTDDDDDREA